VLDDGSDFITGKGKGWGGVSCVLENTHRELNYACPEHWHWPHFNNPVYASSTRQETIL
jgi:hypothetical protein